MQDTPTSLPGLPAPDDIIDAVIEPEVMGEEVRSQTSEVRGEQVTGEEVRSQTSEVRGEEVRGQASEVSAEAGAASPHLTSDFRPLTSDPPSSDLSSDEDRRALSTLGQLIGCDVRPRALLRLARHGPSNVGDLARATRLDAGTLGFHLNRLADLGLLLRDRRGKQRWFQINPDRVRCGRQEGQGGPADTEDTLRINTRPGGLAVVIVMPAIGKPAAGGLAP